MSQRTGILCPACDRQHIESEMVTVAGNYSGGDGASMLKCLAQNHQYERNRLMSLKPRMRQLRIAEKQPPGTQIQQVWVYPQAWSRLQERFPTNLHTTMCSLLNALADDQTIIIEGEHAREFKDLAAQHQITVARGRDIVGLLRAHVELLREIGELRIQQRVLEPLMKMMAGQNGQQGAGTGQLAEAIRAQQPAIGGFDPPPQPASQPPRGHQLAPLMLNDLGEAADAEGNYVEQPDSLAPLTGVPAASSMSSVSHGSGGGVARPGGLPSPTPMRER